MVTLETHNFLRKETGKPPARFPFALPDLSFMASPRLYLACSFFKASLQIPSLLSLAQLPAPEGYLWRLPDERRWHQQPCPRVIGATGRLAGRRGAPTGITGLSCIAAEPSAEPVLRG